MGRNDSTERERNGTRTRQVVLDAAERLFAARGFEGTSLNDVGAEAGVSRGTPGYFFGSKADLYQAVIERCFERVRSAIRSGKARALASGEQPEVVLAGAVSDYFDFINSHPDFVRLMEWEALSDRRSAGDTVSHLEVVREALEAMCTELEIAATGSRDIAQLLLSILSVCWFPLVHRPVVSALGLNPDGAGYLESRKRHVIDLIVRGAREQLAGPGVTTLPALPHTQDSSHV
jgi:TetR/AcrR family transcriptional regulator